MTPFEKAVEKALNAHSKELINLSQGVNAAHQGLLDASRRDGAQNRLIMAAIALIARDSPDPLRTLESVRHLAMSTIGDDDLVEMREHIELALAKVEAALTAR